MNKNGFSLENEVAVDGAENIGLRLDLAGMGNRMLAFLFDSFITGLLSFAVGVVFIFLGLLSGSETMIYVAIAVLTLVLFVIQWGYFIIFELIWHGQSPGKRVLRIKVVREDGRPVGFAASFLRNIMRTADMLPTGYAVGLISMFVSSREKRLGDIVGGTIVVKEPRATLPVLPASALPHSGSTCTDAWGLEKRVHQLSTSEIELIGEYLERRYNLEQGPRSRLSRDLAERFARRFDLEPPADSEKFLEYLGTLVFPVK